MSAGIGSATIAVDDLRAVDVSEIRPEIIQCALDMWREVRPRIRLCPLAKVRWESGSIYGQKVYVVHLPFQFVGGWHWLLLSIYEPSTIIVPDRSDPSWR